MQIHIEYKKKKRFPEVIIPFTGVFLKGQNSIQSSLPRFSSISLYAICYSSPICTISPEIIKLFSIIFHAKFCEAIL